MDLTIIVAVSENNVIGNNNQIPWRISQDLKRFKELTLNHPVIMGRKTYESIPEKFRPLPKRKNIILSNTMQPSDGIYVARNIEEALKLAEDQDTYVAGGRAVYELFLPKANIIELTRVHKNYDGDTFFPELDLTKWNLVDKEEHLEQDIPYSFLTYLKK